ncbi:MAG: aminopeptidase, partial [Gammaproteobacteria bacterium]
MDYIWRICLLGILIPVLSSCASINYYAQSVKGQFELLVKRRSIDIVVQHPDTPDVLKKKLVQVLNIRKFASAQLNLPENGSYKSYADIGREFVVWNIFATPMLSLEPVQWCFLIVGC